MARSRSKHQERMSSPRRPGSLVSLAQAGTVAEAPELTQEKIQRPKLVEDAFQLQTKRSNKFAPFISEGRLKLFSQRT